jgi:hypothetical protein
MSHIRTVRRRLGGFVPRHTCFALLLVLIPACFPAASSAMPAQAAPHVTRPVLAFYYSWYVKSTWSAAHMPDLPKTLYISSDTTTIDTQISEAAGAGITGFISSWWGAGSLEDQNFALLLSRATAYHHQTGAYFTSSINLETDTPQLNSQAKIIAGLHYVIDHYAANPYFFHWQGKPVIFIWDALGGGRTMATWVAIRNAVDPKHKTFWSVDGIDVSLLDDFDAMHMYSAGYWGILQNYMVTLYEGFRSKVNAYNQAHNTDKLWVAGVQAGYDDRKVSGVTNAYVVPRNNGATYALSWQAAMASTPEWVTISTFNQWYQGSAIEPGRAYGTTYLALTKKYIAQWRAQP